MDKGGGGGGVMKKGHIVSYINDTSVANEVVGEVTFCNVTAKEITDYFRSNENDDGWDLFCFGKLHKLVNFENCLFTYEEMIKLCPYVVEMLTINGYNNVSGFVSSSTPRGVRLTNCKIDYGTDDPDEQKREQDWIENYIRSSNLTFTIVQ